jgi:BCD family chlorophyll transporter-like MFS transporter
VIPAPAYLSWLSIFRLGLVQTALGAIVVLTTSTLNRVMVVELALPAMLPGALVGLHYAVQLSRPRWGHGSDSGGRRTPWILGGMAVLAAGGFLAALATAWMEATTAGGIALALLAFLLIGAGVGAAGTSLLALMAVAVSPRRKAASATVVWLMMIAGFAVTATLAGGLLEPYSPARLIQVVGGICALALLVAALAVWGVEGAGRPPKEAAARVPFLTVLREVWAEPKARRFTVFVFVSMLAYSAQDLILEPFAGLVFGMTPGESTALAGTQHAGVFCGMLLVGVGASGLRLGTMNFWVSAGCLGSAAALALIVMAGMAGPGAPIKPAVFALGFSNGAFAVAAIGAMMTLASEGPQGREGVRIGLWGAAQAIAFGLGGFLGAAMADLMRGLLADPAAAYGTVFAAEAGVFLLSAALALRVAGAAAPAPLAAEGAGR